MRRNQGRLEAGNRLAPAAVFDEPLLTYGAHPTNLLANPAVWDETIVLPMPEIGKGSVLNNDTTG